jgi:hypothetical protein
MCFTHVSPDMRLPTTLKRDLYPAWISMHCSRETLYLVQSDADVGAERTEVAKERPMPTTVGS